VDGKKEEQSSLKILRRKEDELRKDKLGKLVE